MSDFLEDMARSSRERVAAAQRRIPLGQLEREAHATAPPPALALDPAGFDLIAELKLRSPAQGPLRGAGEDLAWRVTAYARGGAAAVSVLTEPTRFDGSLEHLESAARVLAPLAVPAMRKDFLVDPYQVFEARRAGAGGVLVILRMLPREQTEALVATAQALGLFVLLEAFDEGDIGLMHELVDRFAPHLRLLAGVNCRDLGTLKVVPRRLMELVPLLPRRVPRVAESGVTSREEAHALSAAGYELALVGSALMRGDDPQQLTEALLTAGRAVRGRG